MNMLGKLKKLGKPEVEVRKRRPTKKVHDKSAKWALRFPSTPYDKYIEEGRGISSRKRGNAWFELSGGKELRDQNGKEYYSRIVRESAADKTSRDAVQIEKDLMRTSIRGRGEMTPDDVENLREVLKAVAYEMRLEGGYCQSMNFIAALLLMYMDNELAFYTQVCLTRNLFSGYFTDELFGMRVDERIFTYLLAEKLPELTDHLSECDISLTNLTFHWFLCLFINVLPLEVTEYIWDRVFYFGSHVIHAASMSIFIHYQKELMRLSDLEEIVVFLNEKLEHTPIETFSKMDTLGITLPRIRIMRIDYTETLREEESVMKKEMARTVSMSVGRQMSMRMSMTRLVSTKDLNDPSLQASDLQLSLDVVMKIKEAVSEYVLQHCAESFGVSVEKLNSKQIRDYCYAGFNQDEFISLWSLLMRKEVIPLQNTNVCVELFKEYQRTRSSSLIVDIREVLIGLMFLVQEKVDAYVRLFYYFSVFDLKSEGVISRSSVHDLITAVYESCHEVTDVQRAADKYVNIIFAVNTQSADVMSFQEFRSLILMQPQIGTFLQLVDLQAEESDESLSPLSSDEQMRTPSTDLLHLDELPPVLAQHPFVQSAKSLPEALQQELGSFLQDMAVIVQERDQLKNEVNKSVGPSAYRDSMRKSIRLSSNRLLSVPMNGSRQMHTESMEMIREEEDDSTGLQRDATKPVKSVDMKMSVRRRA